VTGVFLPVATVVEFPPKHIVIREVEAILAFKHLLKWLFGEAFKGR
jgi:hypothetical protein